MSTVAFPLGQRPSSIIDAGDARSWGGQLPNVVNAGTSLTVSRETHWGRIIALNGSPSAITLPEAIGDGFTIDLLVTAAQAHTVVTADGTNDRFVGLAMINDAGDSSAATVDAYPTASNTNKITASVAGGFGTIGDRCRLVNYAADKWSVQIFSQSSTDPVTPFSNV